MRMPSRPPFTLTSVTAVALAATFATAAVTEAVAEEAAPRGVLIDFTATWCGPCQQMSPLVKRLYREGFPVRKVDIDQRPDLARKFNISGIPAFVVVVDGREVARSVGMTSEAKLRQMLARIPAARDSAAHLAATETPSPVRTLPVSSPPASPSTVATDSGNAVAATPSRMPRSDAPRTFAEEPSPEFEEEPVVRANFDRDDALDRIDVTSRIVGQPMAASTRIRVKDENGMNFGSGTVVDSRPGRTILLSCGHIFRDFEQGGSIEVDVFRDGRSETFLGKLLRFDLEGDVSLIAIPTDGVLPICEVADVAEKAAVDDEVVSVGCGRGDPPSAMRIRVTRLDRYIGPENVECTGVPVQGRSGGGLFDPAGKVVGVCIAADKRDQRGLYAGLGPIHDLLDQCELSYVYRQATENRPTRIAAGPDSVPSGTSSAEPGADGFLQPVAAARVAPNPFEELAAANGGEPAQGNANDDENEIFAHALRTAGDAEVICIVRSHDDPQSNSRVVIINRASPKFVSYLTGELQEQPETVTHRKPIADIAEQSPAEESWSSPKRILPPSRPRSATGPQRYRRLR